MHYRELGRTKLRVSEIGHGTWSMGFMWGPRDDGEARASLLRSLDLGVTFIDTAYAYGEGHSERLIAEAFRMAGCRVTVATKIPPQNGQWPARHHIPVRETFPSEWIVKVTEKSLANLNTDCIDLQQLHVWSDTWLGHEDWLEAVERLKRQGKIRAFGISINDHEPDSALRAVESGLIDTVQVIYNIFDQTPQERLFPLCLKKDVGVIVRVPFDEGSLAGQLAPTTQFVQGDWRQHYFTKERLGETCRRVDRLRPLALRAGLQGLPALALKFCLQHPAVSTVIPGMRRVAHVEASVAVSDGRPLSAEIVGELRKHAWPRNFYPQ